MLPGGGTIDKLMLVDEKTLLAIPAYNCERQIPRVINSLSRLVPLRQKIHQVLIFDNRSLDKTAEVALQAVQKQQAASWIEVVKNEDNYGLGGTHKLAIDWALANSYSRIIFLHGDDQAEAGDLFEILENLENYEAVLGSRFLPNSRLKGYAWERIFGNRVLNVLYSLVTGYKVKDLGSGLNGFRLSVFADKEFLKFSNQFTFNMDLLLDLISKKRNFFYIPIVWKEEDQNSNAKNFKVAWQAVKILWRWKLRVPLLEDRGGPRAFKRLS